MPLAPKPKTKKKTPVKTYTQAEVEAIIRKAYKDAGADLPSPANRRKMMEQMSNAEIDAKMKTAAKARGVPMKKKKPRS